MEGDFGVETEIEMCIGVGIDDVGSGVKFKVGLMEGEALIEGEGDLAGVLDGAGDIDGDGLEEIFIEDSLGDSLGGLTSGDVIDMGTELNGVHQSEIGESSDSVRYLTPMKTIQTTETVVASNQITVLTVIEPPRVGMVFKTWQDVESYYKDYAEQQGFGVSRVQGVNSKKDKTKRIASTWRCECWGRPDMRAFREAKKRVKEMEMTGPGAVVLPDVCEDDETVKGKRTSKKCLCKAKKYASLNDEGDWELKTVVLQHSGHNPTPSKAKLVKEYRMKQMTSNVKRKLLKYFDQGVSVSQFHGCMGTDVNGIDNLSLTVKDLQHEVYKAKRLNMVGGDAVAMMDYFQKMQSGNQNFYYAQRLDEHGRLKDVLWVDTRSRAAYEDFGDVVCFDATYLTNEYELPFVNFIGANHHGQSLLLGCALVSREDCDTFTWIFQQWLTCMNGRAPTAILTDQAAAMRRPLRETMPNIRHRWCIWHILGKIPEKLGKYARYNDFKNPLKAVVYQSFTPEEFHSNWADFIAEYELQDDPWLESLHKESYMWVPAYMKEYFWAGMKTTQRVESINRFFDGFVNRHTKLHEFPRKYSMALAKRVRDEISADSRCSKYVRRLVSGFKLEKYFQKIYTDKKFLEMQTECARMSYCYVRKETVISDNVIEYVLEDRIWIVPPGSSKEVITDGRRFYTVKFCGATKEVICDCQKFETHGILCKHCIRNLDQNFVFEPPKKYILDRWRKDIPRKHTRVKVPYYDPSDDDEGRRFNKMMTCFELICDSAAMVGDEAVDVVMNSLSKLRSQVDEASRKKRDQTKAIRCIAAENRTSPGQAGTTSSVGMPDAAQHTYSEGNPLDTPSGVAATANVKDLIIKKKRPGRPKESRHKTLAELGYRIPKAKAKKGKGVSPDEYLTSPAEPLTQSKCKRKGQTLIKAGNNKKQKKGNNSTQPMCKNRPKAKASAHNEATGSSTPPVLKPKNYTRKKAKSTIPSAVTPKANNTNSKAKSTIPSAANPKANTKSIGKSITPSQLKSKANSNTKLNSKTSDIANTDRVTPATKTSCVQVPGGKGKLPAKRKRKPNALLDSANWVSDLSATF